MVTHNDEIMIHDSSTFIRKEMIRVEFLDKENKIVGMQQCQNQIYVGVICGSLKIMNEFSLNLLLIYKTTSTGNLDLVTTLNLKETMDVFDNTCMVFFFKN